MGKVEKIVRRISPSKNKGQHAVVSDYVLQKLQSESNKPSLGQAAPIYLHVADTAISEADIAKEMQYHPSSSPAQSRADAARALVVRELLQREIERLDLMSEVTDIDGELSEEAAIRLLIEREIDAREPSEADCLRYYEQNKARFHTPDQVHVQHILLAAAPNDSLGRTNARTMADKLIADLQKQPWLFADFALRYSRCPSNEQGGDLGWLVPGQTTTEFDRKVFRLPDGLSDFPIESRWGYHVVKVLARQSGVPLSFERVRDKIAEYLAVQVHQQELNLYLQKLSFEYEVKGLDEIEAQANTVSNSP